jgi:hypothetical protein
MIWSFSEMEATTGSKMGDLEDLKIYVRKNYRDDTMSTLSRRSSVSFRPVARREMRSSQNIPIRITMIGETSIADFSVNPRQHFRNVA